MGRSVWLLLGLLPLTLTQAGCLPMAVAVPLAAAQTVGMVAWRAQDDDSEEVTAPKEKPSTKKSRYAATTRPSMQKRTVKRVPARHDEAPPPLSSGSPEEVAGQVF